MLLLSLSFIFFWAIITCTMTSHPSCFTSYSPILTPPSWFKLMNMWYHQNTLLFLYYLYFLLVTYNIIHHIPSILILYIEISRGLIRNCQSFKCTSYIAKSSLDNFSTTIMYIPSPPLSCSSYFSYFSVLSFSSPHSSCSRAGHAIR